MTVRWTQPAHDDFLGIVAWIAANNPAAASGVGRRILDAVARLDDFPLRGRPGRSPGTRELARSNERSIFVA
jgi:toxin ParE1/3/4